MSLHRMGIVHRDLKPANIMFTTIKNSFTDQEAEIVKVIDFGLCGDLKDTSADSLLYDKCGTVGYLAPELLRSKRGGPLYDCKADIFSLGCIFYYMLTGRSLFKGKNQDATLKINYKCNVNLDPL